MTRSKLPSRWRQRHGAFYYRVPPNERDRWDGKTEFRLGATEAEAWRTWFERLRDDALGEMQTMNHVFDEWWRGYVLRELSHSTHDSYGHHLKPLRKVFGHMRPGAIQPVHAYQYRTKRPRVAGNREVSVLSSALTFAVEKGIINNNPLRGQIRRNKEAPRRRLPSDNEISAFLDVAKHPILQGYVALKRITGLRQVQLLSIDLSKHYREGVLHPPRVKGGKDTTYYGEALEAIIEFIVYRRHGVTGLLTGPLFLSRKGQPYTASGFKSIWQRAMSKWEAAGRERFNEHDIRAVAASDATSLEHAQQLLGHQDAKTTSRIYLRKPVNVEVLKR